MIIPVFLPHLGCRDRCIYCDQNLITDIGEENLRTRIEQSLATRQGPFEVGLYGGNIFGLKPETLKRLFSYFDSYQAAITNFRISTKPVPLNDKIIGILKENRVTTIELGIPTFNDQILEFLNRKHTAADLKNAFRVLTGEGFQVALQVMVGLPHETMSDIRESVTNIINLKPTYIRIYPLAFINGTPLADMYKVQKFVPITFDEAIHRAMLIYLNALQHEIKTVKMGLTDNEVIKEKIIGGYYHPAFGFLVKSEALYSAVMSNIAKAGINKEIAIFINNKDVPHLIGHKRNNLGRFAKASISVNWQTTDISVGTFILNSRKIQVTGTIFDALAEPWGQDDIHH
jgi:histone acetyltransferase (RNA polymerase elongator complex component)